MPNSTILNLPTTTAGVNSNTWFEISDAGVSKKANGYQIAVGLSQNSVLSFTTTTDTVLANSTSRTVAVTGTGGTTVSGNANTLTVTINTSTVYAAANTAQTTGIAAFGAANLAFTHGDQAGTQANTARDAANTAFTHGDQAGTQANTARDAANTAQTQATNAYAQANTGIAQTAVAFAAANTSQTQATNAYAQANVGIAQTAVAFTAANTAFTHGDQAGTQANTARDAANTAQTTGVAAFAKANTAITTSGGSITGELNVSGNLSVTGNLTTGNLTITRGILENVALGTTPPANMNVDLLICSVNYFTSNLTNNTTVNFRGSSTIPLNSVMANGQSMTVSFLLKDNATAYYAKTFQVDGVGVTPKWLNATAPTAGSANNILSYAISIIKTDANVYTILGNQSFYG